MTDDTELVARPGRRTVIRFDPGRRPEPVWMVYDYGRNGYRGDVGHLLNPNATEKTLCGRMSQYRSAWSDCGLVRPDERDRWRKCGACERVAARKGLLP